jgi:Flp pilus assembly protein TadG
MGRQVRQIVGEVAIATFSVDGTCSARRSKRRGASAVEFAVVAPVFFLLVFGMIEYGRLVMVQQILTNAAREGARRAILQDATSSAVITTVRNYLTNASINGNNPNLTITVTPAPEQAQPSDETITVAIRLPYRDVSWLPSPFFLGSTYMNAKSAMRRETF